MDSGSERVQTRMQSLAEVCPDLVLVTDRDGRIEYLNRAPGELPVEHYVGTSVFGLVTPVSAAPLRTCLACVIATGKIECCEVECLDTPRGARRIELRVGPVLCEAEVTGLAMHGRDVTDQQPLRDSDLDASQQEAEEQRRKHLEALAHAARLSTMGQLVAAIAHEINQPLYAITNYASACHNALQAVPGSSPTQLSHWIKEIEKQARRAALIISKLSDFVRKSPPQRTLFDLNKLIINSLDLLRLEARSHRVRIGLELASPVPVVSGDYIQIEQTMVNLLRNAFDAMEFVPPSDRRVVVKTEQVGSLVRVHVEDCGKGLTADELTLLFEPFFTTKERGMGMGLAISRLIIEAHAGRLWATRNPVAGITVHFELPRREERC